MKRKSQSLLLVVLFLMVFRGPLPSQGPADSGRGEMTASELAAVTEQFYHDYGPFDLEADTLQQVPRRMEFNFPEDIWIVGYRTRILDADGKRLAREFQCHTFLGTSTPHHMHNNEAMVGIFSDGYTESLRLPSGHGLFFKAGEKIVWDPMFNNRHPDQTVASIRMTIDLIRAKHLRHPLQKLSMAFRSVQVPDLYYVEPGQDVREAAIRLPPGRIRAIGTHIHPYGVSIELINATQNRAVWKAIGARGEDGRLISMPTYKNPNGYEVGPDDRFKLVATYENPTAERVDAMAGIFVFYSAAP